MLVVLLASAVDDAGKVAAIGVGVGAVLTFAALLVKQYGSATRMTSAQSDKWQAMVTAVEKRAESESAQWQINVAAVEKRAESAERRAEACEGRAAAAERKATLAEGRADLLDLQLDEVRRQLEVLRQQIAAAEILPKREPT